MEQQTDLRGIEGQTALVEAEATEATGVVAGVDGGSIVIRCDQECWPPGESHLVSVSVFAPDALYRIRGKAVASGFDVICDAEAEIERIQRRKWPRRRLDLPVTLCPVEEGTRLAGVPGRTVDVSVGGLCVETLRQLEGEGDPMAILNLPDGTTIVAGTATVAVDDLGDGWRYRLAFQQLDPNDAGRLAVLTTA